MLDNAAFMNTEYLETLILRETKMDDCFDGIDCRSKCDPILMKVLRSAMDIALEKVQPKDGPIKFLNGSSKFYELAVILVDGGFSIVQEEGEIPVRRRKKILSDLEEMR